MSRCRWSRGALWAVALVIWASCGAVRACGHHGHVHQTTEEHARLHQQHKQLLRDVAQENGLQGVIPAPHDDGAAAVPQVEPRGASAGDVQQALVRRRRRVQELQDPAFAAQEPLVQQLARIHQQLQHQQQAAEQQAPLAAALALSGEASDAAGAAPVRLHVEFQAEQLDSVAHATLVAVTSTVVRVLQGYLSVRAPVQGPLLVSPVCTDVSRDRRTCVKWFPSFNTSSRSSSSSFPAPGTKDVAMCGRAVINPAHILDPDSCTLGADGRLASACASHAGTKGQPADMYLYVSAVQDEQCARGAAAWALPCMFDPATNRPLLASANVCPFSLAGTTSTDLLVSIILHEVMHALGFTNALFSSFIDPATRMELPLSRVQRQLIVAGRQVTRVISPGVAREAQAQFGCSTLDGAQLEDEGGSGSANAHWEYSHYQGELMLASTLFSVAGEAPRLSRITLALMEDSGWYVGNWTAAGGPLPWARDTGCTLPTQGCQAFASTTQAVTGQQLFCDAGASAAQGGKLRYTPSASFRSVGQCSTLAFGNNCSMVLARGGAPTCTLVNYQYNDPDVYGWRHTPSSRAYAVTYKMSVPLNDGSGGYMFFPAAGGQGERDAVCYPSSCRGGQLFLNVRGNQVRCPTGRYVDLALALPSLFSQGLVGPCPNEALVCRTLGCAPDACNPAGGACYDGACVCKIGWSGDDCSFSMLTNATAPFPADGDDGAPLPPPPAGAPAPPPMQNLTVWFQQVTVAFELAGLDLGSVGARAGELQGALAAWADVAPQQVRLVGAALVASNATGNASASAAVVLESPLVRTAPREGSLVAVQQQERATEDALPALSSGVVRPAAGRRRLRAEDASGATAGRGTGWWARARRATRRVLWDMLGSTGAVEASPGSAQRVVVTLGVRPGSTLSTTLLVNRLADASQQAELQAQLAAAGFTMVPGSVAHSLSIQQETLVVPVSTPPAQAIADRAQESASQSASSSRKTSWDVIVLASAVGAGAMIIVAAVLGLAFLGRRAASRQQQSALLLQGGAGHLSAPGPRTGASTMVLLPPPPQQQQLPAMASPQQQQQQPLPAMPMHDVAAAALADAGLGMVMGSPARSDKHLADTDPATWYRMPVLGSPAGRAAGQMSGASPRTGGRSPLPSSRMASTGLASTGLAVLVSPRQLQQQSPHPHPSSLVYSPTLDMAGAVAGVVQGNPVLVPLAAPTVSGTPVPTRSQGRRRGTGSSGAQSASSVSMESNPMYTRSPHRYHDEAFE